MSSKHTPGPWFTKREGFSTVYVEARLRGSTIQEVAACGPTEAGSEQQEANARLIAAAPELGEALDDLVREVVLSDIPLPYIDSHFRQWLDKAKAALTKAGVRP